MTAKYTDKSDLSEDHYLTSVLYDFSVMLDDILTSIEDGETGGYLGMTYEQGISLQEPQNVDQAVIDEVNEVVEQLASGEIEVERNVTRSNDRCAARRAGPGSVPGAARPLTMTGVTKSFGPVHALTDADFELAAGEVHGLVGGNGAGKTTLMNVLYGLYRPDAGEIRIDGTRCTSGRRGTPSASGSAWCTSTCSRCRRTPSSRTWCWARRESGGLRDAARRITELSDQFGLAVDPARGRTACRSAPASGWRSSRCSTAVPDPHPRRADDEPDTAGGRRPLRLAAGHRRRGHQRRVHLAQGARGARHLRPHLGHARRPPDDDRAPLGHRRHRAGLADGRRGRVRAVLGARRRARPRRGRRGHRGGDRSGRRRARPGSPSRGSWWPTTRVSRRSGGST